MAHGGHGGHGPWGPWAMGAMGHGGHAPWGPWAMGAMGHGGHGPWAMGSPVVFPAVGLRYYFRPLASDCSGSFFVRYYFQLPCRIPGSVLRRVFLRKKKIIFS